MLLFLATFYASIGVLTLHDTSNNKKEEKAEKSIEKWPFRLIQNKHAISVIFVADEDVILEAANVFFHLRSEKARNCTSQDCSIFFELTKSNDKGNDRSVLDKGFFHTTHFRTKTTERITFKRSPRLRKGEMYQFSFLKRNREIVYAARFMSHHLNENLKLNRSVVGNNTDSFHYYGIKFITKVKQLVPEIEGFKNYEQAEEKNIQEIASLRKLGDKKMHRLPKTNKGIESVKVGRWALGVLVGTATVVVFILATFGYWLKKRWRMFFKEPHVPMEMF